MERRRTSEGVECNETAECLCLTSKAFKFHVHNLDRIPRPPHRFQKVTMNLMLDIRQVDNRKKIDPFPPTSNGARHQMPRLGKAPW